MTDTATKRARLRDIVAAKSFSIGAPFTLVSGKTSNFYFNMKPSMFDPEGAALIADLLFDRIDGDVPWYDAVGGLEMGAVPIVACLSLRSFERGKPITGFFVRKEAKGHGAKRQIEADLKPGMNVLILEDVTTTGGSALKAIAAVRELGCKVTKVVTLVDRLEGAEDHMRAQGVTLLALLNARDFGVGD